MLFLSLSVLSILFLSFSTLSLALSMITKKKGVKSWSDAFVVRTHLYKKQKQREKKQEKQTPWGLPWCATDNVVHPEDHLGSL
jgi:hypothetical protein